MNADEIDEIVIVLALLRQNEARRVDARPIEVDELESKMMVSEDFKRVDPLYRPIHSKMMVHDDFRRMDPLWS
jgi:hypothetical protein